MRTMVMAAVLAAMVAAGARAQTPEEMAAIKPAAGELKWQRIPWVLDLAEGQRTARQERRPIFLWVTGDDPLERC